LHVKGGGNIFKNLDSLLGLKSLVVPPQIVGQVYATDSNKECKTLVSRA